MMDNSLRKESYMTNSSSINDLAPREPNGAFERFTGGTLTDFPDSQRNIPRKIIRRVPVNKLAEYCNPFESDTWNCGSVTKAMVGAAIATDTYLGYDSNVYRDAWDATDHARRIACLVVAGWDEPITLGLWHVPPKSGQRLLVDDGNHRVAAAIYRKDEWILADVSGSVAYMEELFGVKYGDPNKLTLNFR